MNAWIRFWRAVAQVKRYTGHDLWNIGLVPQSAEDIARNGLTHPVQWLPRGRLWTFLADPFVLPEGNGTYRLFAERMDYVKGRGSIWSGVIQPEAGRQWVSLAPLLEADAHMSFPFAYTHQGQDHLLCETWETGGASLYARDAGGWRFKQMLAPGGITVVDAALHHDGERWWLFCCHPGRRPMENLYLYHAPDPIGPWCPHPANPVVRDRAGARPAGPLFRTVDGLMRPSQDCSITYGGALTIKRVVDLTPTTYREEVVRRIAPVRPYSWGLHHLCPAGDFTLIDGKAWRMHPLDPARKLLSIGRAGRRRRRLSGLPAVPRATDAPHPLT